MGAFLLRWQGLVQRELWLDEACTSYYVHYLDHWPADGPDPNLELTTPLYTHLLAGWTNVFGETPLGLRSFSLAAGMAGVLLVGAMGWQMAGRTIGLQAMLLAAVHPLHIYYSQEARAYALWVVWATLTIWLLACAIRATTEQLHARRGRVWAYWLAYGASLVPLLLTHYYALFLLPASVAGLWLVDRARRWRVAVTFAVVHAVLAVLVAAFVWRFILPVTGRGSQTWLRDTWQGYPPIAAMFRSLLAMLPSGGYPDYLGPLHQATAVAEDWLSGFAPLIIVALPLLMVIVATPIACFAGGTKSEANHGSGEVRSEPNTERSADQDAATMPNAGRPSPPQVLRFLSLLIFLALLVPWLYSLLRSPAYIVGRYDMYIWPAMMIALPLLMRSAVSRLVACCVRRDVYSWLVVIVLAFCSLLTVSAARAVPTGADMEERVALLADRTNAGDLIITQNMYRWHLVYELHRQRFDGEVRSFPSWHDKQVGWSDPVAELQDTRRLVGDAQRTADLIQHMLDQGKGVYLLTFGEPDEPATDVARLFLQVLAQRGFRFEPVDEWLGLIRILPSSEDS